MNKYCISKSYTIKEAIDTIDQNRDRAVLVVNDGKKIIGIISQGDIIRALSSGITIYSRVENIIQPNFLYMNSRDMKKAFEIFESRKITLLPVINEDYELQSVITLTDIYKFLKGEDNE